MSFMHHYSFRSTWRINAPKQLVEQKIENIESWPDWWQGVESATIHHKNSHYIGSRAGITWKAPLGYRLRLTITITDHAPGQLLHFTSAGDLDGYGSWSFKEKSSRTDMVIIWEVRTTKPWMNRLAFILKPLFIRGHHTVMKNGEKSLRALLETNP